MEALAPSACLTSSGVCHKRRYIRYDAAKPRGLNRALNCAQPNEIHNGERAVGDSLNISGSPLS